MPLHHLHLLLIEDNPFDADLFRRAMLLHDATITITHIDSYQAAYTHLRVSQLLFRPTMG